MLLLRGRADEPALVNTSKLPWVESPAAGVERKMLERAGEEVARATSIVRFSAGSQFPPHVHGLGEEVFVLKGVFCDEHGEYPAGTYIRNPWGSDHRPFSREGCELFVKLRQLPAGETRTVVMTNDHGTPLFEGSRERVRTVRLEPSEVLALPERSTLEGLVLQGSLDIGGARWPARSWFRMPPSCLLQVLACEKVELWLKATW